MDTPQEKQTFFADVVLPVPVNQYFTYRIPFEYADEIQVGSRVIVQFGKRRIVTAIVVKKHQQAPVTQQVKYVLDLLDDEPCVNQIQIQFWEWVAEYYMCSIGEVMNVALPSGFKLTSQSRIQINPEFSIEAHQITLSERELNLLSELQKKDSLAYHEAGEVLEVENPYKIIKYLIAKRAIIIYEEVKEKYKPKIQKKIRLHEDWVVREDKLNELFDEVKSSVKQEEVLLKYLSLIPLHNLPEKNKVGVEKSVLLKNDISASSLKTLVKKNILVEFEEIVPRFEYKDNKQSKEILLSHKQKEVRDEILDIYKEKDTALIYGVTGSGKTEIYIDLIKKVLDSGSQVLLLLPEIVLTTQIVNRLQHVFGDNMGVYHSRFSDNERVEVWNGVLSGRFTFIVGVRSSLFLPFDNLGLIVVDEEHDSSYKQYDPAPRYNARDAAQVLARLHHAKVLLGSATPSIESYYLATAGFYGLVEIKERYGNASMPDIVLSDLRKEKKQRKIRGEFSSMLVSEVESSLNNSKQVILFQNRRGYAPYIMCEDCGHIPTCENCAVSLTYHMYRNIMVCHYCGHKEPVPKKCSSCNSNKIKTAGLGTEKVEDEIKEIFPNARVQRMDLDTTRKKYSYQKILDEFGSGQTDILVGTQMVSKGLDFDNVNLVGIFDIDRLIFYPDFRSHERAFQLISQVSGRAGRREDKGKVVLQTSSPKHPLMNNIVNHNYESFFYTEIRERKNHDYPPFTRLIRLTVRNADRDITMMQADKLAWELKNQLGSKRILGPESPMIDKIRNLYLKDILIKIERNKINLKQVKKTIIDSINNVNDKKRFKQLDVLIDVDCL
ncbi:MAG: primosomal protein N' [Thalassobius sp.]|nr:primosomal protein N' [Thalassovita sp.]